MVSLQVLGYYFTRKLHCRERFNVAQWNHAAWIFIGLSIPAYKKHGLLLRMQWISVEPRQLYIYRSSDDTVQDDRSLLRRQERLTGTMLLVSQYCSRCQRTKNGIAAKDTNHLTGTTPFRWQHRWWYELKGKPLVTMLSLVSRWKAKNGIEFMVLGITICVTDILWDRQCFSMEVNHVFEETLLCISSEKMDLTESDRW